MPSNLDLLVSPDDPADLSAGWKFDRTDRRKVDDQILAIQRQMLRGALRGVTGTWMMLDSAASRNGAAGDCVCLAPSSSGADTVTLATTASLAAAGGVFGVLTAAYAKGGLAHVATAGALPRSITGLDVLAGDAQFVRVDPTTSRCQRVTSIGGGDFQVGRVDALGNLFIQRTAAAAAGVGGSGGVDGPVSSTVNAFPLWAVSDGSTLKNSLYTGHPDASVTAPKDVATKEYADSVIQPTFSTPSIVTASANTTLFTFTLADDSYYVIDLDITVRDTTNGWAEWVDSVKWARASGGAPEELSTSKGPQPWVKPGSSLTTVLVGQWITYAAAGNLLVISIVKATTAHVRVDPLIWVNGRPLVAAT